MLQPKKTKHRKWQKGRSRKRMVETRGTKLSFGNFGLQSLSASYVNSKQIEAARKAISHFTKRGGKVWIRIFPDKPITQRPPELTMGGGKGAVDHYVFPVKPGRVIFEVDGLPPQQAREALAKAAHKLPVRTRVIEK
ncbi:MAG: ribosomal protein L16, large subunit ribosomal protein L16 [Candidatus Wolfebacteria bacterium GW2011_GWC1_43_10]|uniref:Large ribosomal subunit protein uL16 n=2 Tax=Candidatus Wolfeibacteriota TaxID=1752735 RepID=A0A0G1C7Z7_9BACT|nr:MAG: ribosomal protein L16, large subunit ribosomal protein L16 [Candidatus Wolfebacteria bacterium GW2011_GWC1_43_10]OGM89915.1 MAG: 50S ribosomal protein L16 [Candidatus Wolfebacteria bacterium GWA1_42_9]